MRKQLFALGFAAPLALTLSLASSPAHAGDTAKVPDNPPKALDCHMSFSLSGWSIFYQTAAGRGTVSCSNGAQLKVILSAKGGGLTVGKYKITDGHGAFSGLTDITQALGSYAMANAHAGAVKSTSAMALTKGPVSLALTGFGTGWDVGAGFSAVTIKQAKQERR